MRLWRLDALSILALGIAFFGAFQVSGAEPHSQANSIARTENKGVLDLGQLEVEGEVRRPNVIWIDSSKRIQAMLPRLHAVQFKALEDELLEPMSLEQAQAIANAPANQRTSHVEK